VALFSALVGHHTASGRCARKGTESNRDSVINNLHVGESGVNLLLRMLAITLTYSVTARSRVPLAGSGCSFDWSLAGQWDLGFLRWRSRLFGGNPGRPIFRVLSLTNAGAPNKSRYEPSFVGLFYVDENTTPPIRRILGLPHSAYFLP